MPEQKREGRRGEVSTSFLHMSSIVTLSPSFKISILIWPFYRIETQAGHSPIRWPQEVCLHVYMHINVACIMHSKVAVCISIIMYACYQYINSIATIN